MLTLESNGSVTFRVYLPHAECVEVLADFSNWQSGRLPMRRDDADPAGPGWWSLRVEAPEGDHAFAYLVDGRCWLPDYAAHGVERNSCGNWISRVSVPRRRGELVVRDKRRELQHRPGDDALAGSWRIEGALRAEHPCCG